jgi:hypothetical protein
MNAFLQIDKKFEEKQKNKEFIHFHLTAFIKIVWQLIDCAIRKVFKK